MLARVKRINSIDVIAFLVLTIFSLTIFIPFYNVIVVSFANAKEYLSAPFMIFPKAPTLNNYAQLFYGNRVWTGYRTTLFILAVGVPLNLFLTTSLAYALSRPRYPGRRFVFAYIMFTMLFSGGFLPAYLNIKQLGLIDTIWSVILSSGADTFLVIVMMSYFYSLPESLAESARLDGAGEWTILFRIILPLSGPILATIGLFYAVGRWNEWFSAMLYINNRNIEPLQLVLREIVINSQVLEHLRNDAPESVARQPFSMGIKMAVVIVTMLPVMCVYPFLQKYFTAGVLTGAIKA